MTFAKLIESAIHLLRWWVVVAPWEQGLRVRFGKTSKDLAPGIHFRIPLLDRVYVVCTRSRVIYCTNVTLTTKDRQVVTVSFCITYAIDSLRKVIDKTAQPEILLLTETQNEIALFVGDTNLAEVDPSSVEEYCGDDDWLENFAGDHGLKGVNVKVTGFAHVRTYRLLMNDYQSTTGMDSVIGHDAAREAAQG